MNHQQNAVPYCDLFREAMARVGIVTDVVIVADGRIHRFPLNGDKRFRKNGWYFLCGDKYPVGWFGAWNRGCSYKWEHELPKGLRATQRAAIEKQREEIRAAQTAEIKERQEKAQKVARYVWDHALEAPEEHAYLKSKGIKPHETRLYRGMLVVPVRSPDGVLHSLQLIAPSGEKRFLKSGRISGCCYCIRARQGKQGNRIYICEGFATGATIHELTGDAVVIAFSASNLKTVSSAFRTGYPDSELVIAADNDQWTQGNPGQTYAIEAAKAANAKLVFPRFGDISTRPTDFNDLFALLSAVEVRRQLEPTGLSELLDAAQSFIRSFLVMSDSQAQVVALWVAHTYVFDAADTTMYLSITSPEKRSGKSRLLEVLDLLVAKSWYTGRVTPAVLPRKIDAERPTLLLDESDAAFSGDREYAEVLRGILNSGHRRGGKISCCVGHGANISYRDLSTFCPKAIAGIGKLPDTVQDRAIPIRMKRCKSEERSQIERFRLRKVENQARWLCAELQIWSTSAIDALRVAEPDLPDELNDRQQDTAEPLLAIADVAGGAWPHVARKALLELCTSTHAADDSIGAQLLGDIKTIFEERKTDRLPSGDLVQALGEIESSPWAEWSSGKPITQPGLAKLLRPFGIIPGSVRINNKTPKGYKIEQFEDAFKRYVPVMDSNSLPSTPRESATPQQPNNYAGLTDFEGRNKVENVAAEKSGNTNGMSKVAGVAVSNMSAQRQSGESAPPANTSGMESDRGAADKEYDL